MGLLNNKMKLNVKEYLDVERAKRRNNFLEERRILKEEVKKLNMKGDNNEILSEM